MAEATKLYRVKRGQYTRREGADPSKGVRGTHRHYGVNAEVELTEAQAAAFGLNRLERIHKRGIDTTSGPNTGGEQDTNPSNLSQPTSDRNVKGTGARPPADERLADTTGAGDEKQSDEDAQATAKKAKAKALLASADDDDYHVWRKKVQESGVLGDDVPSKKAEIIDALEDASK